MDLPIPCPINAGWELVRTVVLPREGRDGLPLGGFSAAAYQPRFDRLWLLSDAAQGHLVPWGGLARLLRQQAGGLNRKATLKPGPRLLLRDRDGRPLSAGFDGEALVLDGHQAWIASEGLRTANRPARLVRFDLRSGLQQESRPLPSSWQARPGQGLAANKGPESLTRLSSGDLLLAAERPLLQSRAKALIPVARSSAEGLPQPAGALDLRSAAPADGLTDLLALPQQQRLLALVRGYQPPLDWSARLLLFRLTMSAAAPLQPLTGWDLLKTGLPPDNWEGLTVGPRLSDGRSTLVLVSDDNFSPLQANHVAVLAPRRNIGCSD